jgi:hypothetical protein
MGHHHPVRDFRRLRPPQRLRNNALTIFYVAIPVGAQLANDHYGLIVAHWGWRHALIWAGPPGCASRWCSRRLPNWNVAGPGRAAETAKTLPSATL